MGQAHQGKARTDAQDPGARPGIEDLKGGPLAKIIGGAGIQVSRKDFEQLL